MLKVIILISLVFIILITIGSTINIVRRIKIDKKIEYLVDEANPISSTNFNEFKQRIHSTTRTSVYNVPGVYILYNKNNSKYYIGQSKTMIYRVTNHFKGKGSPDVYKSYINGDKFIIRMIPLENSGFKNLNDFERYTIRKFKAYKYSYNKTRGNKNYK